MPSIYVQAPIAGEQRQLGFQNQPPYSSVESLNFWPIDVVTGRHISATRPPMVAIASPGTAVNLLVRVNGDATQSPQISMVSATGGNLYYWNGASWVAATMGAVAIPTGRNVYATTFLKKVFIMDDTLAPAVFDYENNAVTQAVATAGTFPVDCRVAATWEGGIWVAGAQARPQVVSGSRTGDPYDWDFDEEDTGAAFELAGENFGLISEAVTALIPHTSDTMIIACETSLWALRGHPLRGGTLEAISSTVGVLGQGAWAKDPNDNLYFISKAGLCKLAPGSGNPIPISREKIPDELISLDFTYLNPKISMAYDSRWNGLHIAVRGAQEQAWWYDLDTGGFHRMSFSAYPNVMLYFPTLEAEGVSGVLHGGVGYGGVARFDTTGEEEFDYRLLAGPVKLSPSPMRKSLINQAQHILGGNTTDSSNLAIRIWAGGTGEDAYNKYLTNNAVSTHEVTVDKMLRSGGRCMPRVGGYAAIIELAGSGLGTRLVYEGSQFDLEPAGNTHMVSSRVGSSYDPSFVFNPSRWAAFATATATAPASALSEFPLFVDLSRLPQGWWDVVHSTGRDIRVTGASSQLLPIDLVSFDSDAQTGFLVVKKDVDSDPAVTLRIYAGNPSVFAPGSNSSIGRFNAYPANLLWFLPSGGNSDRARKNVPFEISGATEGDVVGVAGARGTFYGNNAFVGYEVEEPTFTLPIGTGISFLGWVKPVQLAISGANTSLQQFQFDFAGGAAISYRVSRVSAVNSLRAFGNEGESGQTTANTAIVTSLPSTGSYHHIGAVIPDVSQSLPGRLYVDGVLGDASNSNLGATIPDPLPPAWEITLFSGVVDGSRQITQNYSLVMVIGDVVSANFIAYQSSMSNQTTFWGTWTLG